MPVFQFRRLLPQIAAVVLASGIAGCGGSMPSLDLGWGSTGTTAPPPPQPRGPTPPPTDLNGRWMLSSSGGASCRMTIAAAPGAGEGTIRPEGGCPGNFFTSRKWTFEDGALVVRNHNSEPLAQLTPDGPTRFAGDAPNGQQITLTR